MKIWKSSKVKLVAIGLLVAALVMSFSPISVSIVPSGGDSLSIGSGQLSLKIGNPVYATGSLDYVTDGVNDNVEWAQLFAILASHGGGVAYSISSNFSFGAAVTVPANVIVRGSGTGFIFSRDGINPIFIASSNDTFTDIRTDAGGITLASDTVLVHSILGSTNYGFVSTGSANFSAINAPTGRGASVFVAASNAMAHSIAQADYVTDGVDDQVQIQAAINSLPASGGTVLLSEGRFNISAPISLYRDIVGTWFNVTLQGMGIGSASATGGATVIFLSNGSNSHMITNIVTANDSGWKVVRDLALYGNKAGQTSLNLDGIHYEKTGVGGMFDQDITNVYVDGVTGTGVYIEQGWGVHLSNVISEHNGLDGIYLRGTQLYVDRIYPKANARHGLYLKTDESQFVNVTSESNGANGIYFPVGRWNNFANIIIDNWGSNNTANWGGLYLGDSGAGSSVDHSNFSNVSIFGSRGFQTANYPFKLLRGDSNTVNGVTIDMTDTTDVSVRLYSFGTTNNTISNVTLAGSVALTPPDDAGTGNKLVNISDFANNSGNVTLTAGRGAVDVTSGLNNGGYWFVKTVEVTPAGNPGVGTTFYTGNYTLGKFTIYATTNVTNNTPIFWKASLY